MARCLSALATALIAGLVLSAVCAAAPNPHAGIDCDFCHADTPRFGVDTRDTVNFWRAEGDEPQLCERCHAPAANFHPLGVVPGPEHLGTGRPASLPLGETDAVRDQVVCTTCHFLHAANADFGLLRGFPGSESPGTFATWQDLCRECHGAGLAQRSPHAGDDRACAFCHFTKPQTVQPVTVTAAGRRLCEFCHGSKDAGHYAGANPFKEPQPCTGCHDPHLGTDSPARLRAGYYDPLFTSVRLNPHRKRTLCFACHTDGKPGSKVRSGPVALCQRCHGSGEIPGMSHPLAEVPAGSAIPQGWPLTGGKLTCLTCHFPGHPRSAVPAGPDESGILPHLLRGGVPGERSAVCFLCHGREQWKNRNPHLEVASKKTGCGQCHAKQPVWGQDRADTVSFVADINILCLACHNVAEHPGGVTHTVTLAGAKIPPPGTLPLGSGRRITCATCHNPHIDPPAGPWLRGGVEPVAFCRRCHKF